MRLDIKCPSSVKPKCPNCGSTNIVCETEIPIRFMFSKEGKYEIFWGTPYRCECQDCDEVFESE